MKIIDSGKIKIRMTALYLEYGDISDIRKPSGKKRLMEMELVKQKYLVQLLWYVRRRILYCSNKKISRS